MPEEALKARPKDDKPKVVCPPGIAYHKLDPQYFSRLLDECNNKAPKFEENETGWPW
jgi:hypothetical protein